MLIPIFQLDYPLFVTWNRNADVKGRDRQEKHLGTALHFETQNRDNRRASNILYRSPSLSKGRADEVLGRAAITGSA